MDDLLENITIYHKTNDGWAKYPKVASVRDTSIRNRNTTGKSDTDRVLIRIFDVDGYNKDYYVSKDDVIVRGNVKDEITTAPLTDLRKIYGKDNVYLVVSIDKFIFKEDIDLQHIKIGAI